ncbi:MAG: DUF2232 domain-containing protein [Gemmatimonadota bacterium]
MSRRGWPLARTLALGLTVVLVSPLSPLVLVGVPLAVFLLAFPGRSPATAALAGLILVAVLSGLSTASSPVWFAERAWAFLLAGGFVVATLLAPGGAPLRRSIVALAITLGSVALFAGLRPEAVAEVDWWIGMRLERAVYLAHEWTGSPVLAGLAATLRKAVRIQTALYPALLGLASLGALGLAWYVAARLRGAEESPAPLREFRFSDQLVWVLIGGLLLFLLPAGELAARLGENAMAFMGGLYLVRGLAVLAWIGALLVTSAWSVALWTLLAVLFYPVIVGAALVVGLGDTWLDLRARWRRASDGAE